MFIVSVLPCRFVKRAFLPFTASEPAHSSDYLNILEGKENGQLYRKNVFWKDHWTTAAYKWAPEPTIEEDPGTRDRVSKSTAFRSTERRHVHEVVMFSSKRITLLRKGLLSPQFRMLSFLNFSFLSFEGTNPVSRWFPVLAA